MQSIIQQRGAVQFPEFEAERIYMEAFTQERGLPERFKRWQPTVDQMLVGIEVDGPIYLMVDQKIVVAGTPQRRPGMHIDGYWVPAIHAHQMPGRHGHDQGSHDHRRNDDRHMTRSGSHNHITDVTDWPTEAIILASSHQGARALVGEWDGVIGEGGDCTHLDLSHLKEVVLESNKVWAGNVTMLHESLPLTHDCQRTLVRLNVPGWSPQIMETE